jgi:hypothetical protein
MSENNDDTPTHEEGIMFASTIKKVPPVNKTWNYNQERIHNMVSVLPPIMVLTHNLVHHFLRKRRNQQYISQST